jgi:hypothetical protein
MIKGILKQIRQILIHKWYVFEICCKLGIPLQGLFHDLSKFSFAELIEGSKYYRGDVSPHVESRKQIGYSLAWINHKAKNKHHWEMWLDINADGEFIPAPMPNKYIKEMLADRISACKAYEGKNWNHSSALNYYNKNKDKYIMHEDTKEKILTCLTLVKEQKELSFKQIKKILK